MKGRDLTALVALLATAALVWHFCLFFGFTSDSFLLSLLLDEAGRVDWDRVGAEWTSPWLGVEGAATWRPLITLHYALDLALWGASAPALHASNLLFHLGGGALVFLLLRRLFPGAGLWAPLLGSFLYLVHPARVEAVAWVPGRVDTTPAFFAALAALLHAYAADRRPRLCTLLSLGAAFLAYTAKEMALALPATLLFVSLYRRPRRRSEAISLALHLLLLAGVLLWRIHLLGGVAGAEGSGGLLFRAWETLPGKATAAFAPPLMEAPRWLLLLLGLGVPLAAGLVRGRAALAAVPCLLWWALLLLPAAPVPVQADLTGSRVLLLPALAAAALYTLLLAPPPPGRDLWPLGSLRWVAGGLLGALALAGTLERLDQLEDAAARADRVRADLAREERPPGAGPLAVAMLPEPAGWAKPFRYDVAFLAFRRPFAEREQECLVLHNLFLGKGGDAGSLRQAALLCRRTLIWNEEREAMVPFPLVPMADRNVAPPGREMGADGSLATPIRLGGEEGGWSRLDLPPLPAGPGAAALEVACTNDPAQGELILLWTRPGEQGKGDPLALDPRHRCRLSRLPGAGAGRGRRWLCSCGDRLEFLAAHLGATPPALVLAGRGGVRVSRLTWRGDLPRPAWRPPAQVTLDPAAPAFPLPPRRAGPCRLVLLTPSKVLRHDFTASGRERLLVEEGEIPAILRFLARVAPYTPYYYYVDHLSRRGGPGTAIARTGPVLVRHARSDPQRRQGRKGRPGDQEEH